MEKTNLLLNIKNHENISDLEIKTEFLNIIKESRNIVQQNESLKQEILKLKKSNESQQLELQDKRFELLILKSELNYIEQQDRAHEELDIEPEEKFLAAFPNLNLNGKELMLKRLEHEQSERKTLIDLLKKEEEELRNQDKTLRLKKAVIEQTAGELGNIRSFVEKLI